MFTCKTRVKLDKCTVRSTQLFSSAVLVEKPNYEVGSAATLSFGQKLSAQKAKVAAVWTIDNDDDDVAEVIDADELLDEEDLAKPDPSSNRGNFLGFGISVDILPYILNTNVLVVCGTTGKKKACKDCSCGLAEELAGEKPKADPNAKSSCGSVSMMVYCCDIVVRFLNICFFCLLRMFNTVLSGRCIPMCFMSVFGYARF